MTAARFATWLLERGQDPSAVVAEARAVLDAASAASPDDYEIHLRRAQVDLVAARSAGAAPAARALFEAALGAVARAAPLAARDAEAPQEQAKIERRLADWRLARREPAAAGIERGLQAASRAFALCPNARAAEAVAERSVLLRLQSRQTRSADERAALLAEAATELRRAHALNPLLVRDYPP